MNKQEFIEKLKMHGAWCTECHDIHGEKDRYVKFAKVRELLEQIDEPQAEKVEVPGFIDKLIRKYKARNETLFCSIADLYNDSDEYKWYVDNVEIYERAWVNGYTVKLKQWVVRQGGSEVWYLQGFRNSLDGDIVKQWCSHEGCIKFTDKSKAEAVATLVEGSVEEV
ncbi:DUF1642 domain-containing protein [Enterococcus sp.]|uniref:DUF1642 domain-containing protein n=1 Tax=Enterococcus sp. TaxID=35783 RepID=UPI002FC71A30